jgi:hypothetical protein
MHTASQVGAVFGMEEPPAGQHSVHPRILPAESVLQDNLGDSHHVSPTREIGRTRLQKLRRQSQPTSDSR